MGVAVQESGRRCETFGGALWRGQETAPQRGFSRWSLLLPFLPRLLGGRLPFFQPVLQLLALFVG